MWPRTYAKHWCALCICAPSVRIFNGHQYHHRRQAVMRVHVHGQIGCFEKGFRVLAQEFPSHRIIVNIVNWRAEKENWMRENEWHRCLINARTVVPFHFPLWWLASLLRRREREIRCEFPHSWGHYYIFIERNLERIDEMAKKRLGNATMNFRSTFNFHI